jgi:flagellar hook-basal body complex protein FliE
MAMTGVDRAAMAVSGMVTQTSGTPGAGTLKTPIGVSDGAPTQTPFAGVIHALIDQTSTLGKQASDAVNGLLSGQGVEIHDVMIAQQKASVAFELALQVRNKAVSAYQQMMGMQF